MSEDFSRDIVDAAHVLNIDLTKDPGYSWLVSRALEHRIDPEEWKEVVQDSGQVAYFNMKSGVRLPYPHPHIFEIDCVHGSSCEADLRQRVFSFETS